MLTEHQQMFLSLRVKVLPEPLTRTIFAEPELIPESHCRELDE